MLESLMDSPIAWAVLSFVTIASLVYAIICQHRNKERKEFSYCLKSNILIKKKKSKFEKLYISYADQAIDNLCVSRISIWNSGNKTLTNSDMVESKEITLSMQGENKVLDEELIAVSEETNKFSITKIDDHTVKIIFDYVEPQDGVVMQIIHTGTEQDVLIDCKIKGGKPVKELDYDADEFIRKTITWKEKISGLIFIGVAILSIFFVSLWGTVSIFDPYFEPQIKLLIIGESSQPQKANTVVTIILLVYFTLAVLGYIVHLKKYFYMGFLKKVKKYSDFKD